MIINTPQTPNAPDITYGMTEMSDPELATINGGELFNININFNIDVNAAINEFWQGFQAGAKWLVGIC